MANCWEVSLCMLENCLRQVACDGPNTSNMKEEERCKPHYPIAICALHKGWTPFLHGLVALPHWFMLSSSRSGGIWQCPCNLNSYIMFLLERHTSQAIPTYVESATALSRISFRELHILNPGMPVCTCVNECNHCIQLPYNSILM